MILTELKLYLALKFCQSTKAEGGYTSELHVYCDEIDIFMTKASPESKLISKSICPDKEEKEILLTRLNIARMFSHITERYIDLMDARKKDMKY